MRKRPTTLLLLMAIITFTTAGALARPFRGPIAWSMILCRFSDSDTPPKTPEFYRDMFHRTGTGGHADFWQYTSYQGVNLNGSVVRGWYRQPFTLAQAQARTREQRFQDCLDAARNSPTNAYTPPPGQLVAIVTYPDLDLFGWPGKGAFLPASVDVGGMGHEVGHGMGLHHSFSDDPTYRNAPWAQIGEYDDQWDLMSYANVFGTATTRFGNGGPSLNAYHRDRMGWLPGNRILTFGANGATAGTVTLAPLNHPHVSGDLQVRVPFDPADPFRYYVLDFRQRSFWDAGIPSDAVLIHEIRKNEHGTYLSYLRRNHTGSRAPLQELNENGVRIRVLSIDSATRQARVEIQSNYANRCLQGYVWREAGPGDLVCVTPTTRQQARQQNQLGPGRRNPNGGPYGPDTCLQGYVWREAFPGDRVCVTGAERTQAQNDNRLGASRRNPARHVYGPNTCKVGFVWREADSSDWVCVTPQVRAQVQEDNARAASRRNPRGGPHGPDTCLQGFVWREAFPNDRVCVTTDRRTQARVDNAAAHSRLLAP